MMFFRGSLFLGAKLEYISDAHFKSSFPAGILHAHDILYGVIKMPKQLHADVQSLTGNPDYEHLIQSRVAAALESNDYMKGFKRMNFKLNLCIGLFTLKLFLDVGGSSYFFR